MDNFFNIARNVYIRHGVTTIDYNSDVAFLLATDEEFDEMRKAIQQRDEEIYNHLLNRELYVNNVL